MSRISRRTKCVDCGKEFLRKQLNRKFRCPECAWRKMCRVAEEIHSKSGPEYEHWKEKLEASLRRI